MDATIISMLVAGLFSANVVTMGGTGLELATNNLNTIKNALYYTFIVFVVGLLSLITLHVVNLILISYELQSYLIVVALLTISMYVQMAEYVCKKALPLFFTQTRYFVPSLVGTLFMLILSTYSSSTSLINMILDVLFISAGIMITLVLIAGIRQNYQNKNVAAVFKGNLLSLIILLLLMLAWTAF